MTDTVTAWLCPICDELVEPSTDCPTPGAAHPVKLPSLVEWHGLVEMVGIPQGGDGMLHVDRDSYLLNPQRSRVIEDRSAHSTSSSS